MIYGGMTATLATALESHAALTALDLDHNPILDGGGIAIANVLATTRIATVSLCFTGVADGTCEALGKALGKPSCRLRTLALKGNHATTAGASALAASLGLLTSLDLTANLRMEGAATIALAKALPASRLVALRLAGCKVDKKACARLAAALVQSRLATLDLSSNHFGSSGSDELAWALGECDALTSLNLADCNIEDDGAEELADALSGDSPPPALQAIDLRWNRLTGDHQDGRGVSADRRVDATAQKQLSAAEKQTAHLEATWAAAQAAGKKVYVPKWQREEQKRRNAAAGKQ